RDLRSTSVAMWVFFEPVIRSLRRSPRMTQVCSGKVTQAGVDTIADVFETRATDQPLTALHGTTKRRAGGAQAAFEGARFRISPLGRGGRGRRCGSCGTGGEGD